MPSIRREDPEGGAEDLVRLYLTEIGRHPLLSRRDEVQLAQAMEAGKSARAVIEDHGGELSPRRRRELSRAVHEGEEARRRFLESNLRLVVSLAKNYQASGVPLLDLVQEGNLGLMHAVAKFDWRRGCRFSTYATWWIRQAVRNGIARTDGAIRLPRDVRWTVVRARAEQASLELELGRPATLSELGSAVAMAEDKLLKALNARTGTVSLSSPVTDDGHTELGEVVDASAPGPEERAIDRAQHEELARLLGTLSPRDRDILHLRYGFGDDVWRSRSEVAAIVGLTPQRVGRIEARALQQLRQRCEHLQRPLPPGTLPMKTRSA
ncbi:MAG TPA: sigma-70 family RNA polymerase sigma factor [Acidimicrobiales bacterium]|nr:sigma-70 family RNA polymerase sigma factor [Acidimicrobiales bacterium]